jgi:hypothetical protein
MSCSRTRPVDVYSRDDEWCSPILGTDEPRREVNRREQALLRVERNARH